MERDGQMRRWGAGLVAGMLGVLGAAGLAFAPAAQAAGTLTFATFNVCKVNCAAPAPSWDIRRDRIVRVISAASPDVLGLQEVTNNPTSTAKTQADDVRALLASAGYAQVSIDPNSPDNECRRPRDAAGQLAGPSPCENTAFLAYKTTTVQEYDTPVGSNAGRILSSSIVGGLSPAAAARSVEWGYLVGLNGAGPFLAISLHTDSEKSPTAEADRVAIAGALAGWGAATNAAHGMPATTPVVLMADLNSFAKRQPNGAQAVLTNAGWKDAFSAKAKTNVRYSTINYNPRLADGSGFPVRPFKFKPSKKNPLGAATRIDYIMALGPGVTFTSYEHVVFLNGDGSFNADYQASDHQMVKAQINFS